MSLAATSDAGMQDMIAVIFMVGFDPIAHSRDLLHWGEGIHEYYRYVK